MHNIESLEHQVHPVTGYTDKTSGSKKAFSNTTNKSKNEDRKYDCQKCDFQTAKPGNLKRHVASIHDGVRYSCSQCDFDTAKPSYLKQHVASIHDDVRYSCSRCDFKTTKSSYLKRHT